MIALIDNLTRAGKPPTVLDVAEGGRMLVLPEYGRILGLYAGDSDENFFWTNPALTTAESATEFFRRDGWLKPSTNWNITPPPWRPRTGGIAPATGPSSGPFAVLARISQRRRKISWGYQCFN